MSSGMVGEKRGVGVLILVALLIALLPFSAAQTLELGNVVVNPNSVWVTDDYSIRFLARCLWNGSGVSNADVRAEIYPPGFNNPTFSPVLSYNPGSGAYEYSIDSILNDVGTYTVKFVCRYFGQETSTARQFSLHNIDLDIQKSQAKKFETFRGGQLTIPVVFKQDNQLVVPSQNTFNVKVGGSKMKQVGVPQIKNGQQEIVVDIPLDSNVRDGIYDLEVTGYAQGESLTSSVKDGVIINAPLKIKLMQKEIVCPQGSSCNAVIDAQVLFYDGYISELNAEDNFEAVLTGGSSRSVKVVYISNVSCDDSSRVCRIGVSIPSNLDSEAYELFITVAYPSISSYTYRSQDSMTLNMILRLSGTLEDSKGSAVESTMTFMNAESGNNIVMQSRGTGKYSIDLLPGVYDVEIKFSTGVVSRFYSCDITPSNIALLAGNVIRYDNGNVRGGGLDGLNAVAVNVIEFGLPFEKAIMMTPYDSSRVMGDERDLQLFACRNWNFMKSTCTGTWEILPSKIHTIEDVAEFQINSSGAFVVGEAKQIHFNNVEILNKEYSLGEPVDIKGKVLDMDGGYVEGAVVTANLVAENRSSKAATSRDGRFSILLNAPYTDGVNELVLSVVKGPYVSEDYKTSINVVRKMELTIVDIPDVVEVEMNRKSKVQFNVFNSGQVNFTEPLYVHMSGVPSSWYNIAPLKINDLQIGEKRAVEMEFRITDAVCGKDCNPYSLVNVEVKSGDYSQAMSYSLRITNPANKTSEVKEDGGAAAAITGFMSSFNPSSIANGGTVYVVLVGAIALLVALIYLKSRRGVRVGGAGRSAERQARLSSFIAPPPKRSTLSAAGPARRDSFDSSRISKLYRIKEQLESNGKKV